MTRKGFVVIKGYIDLPQSERDEVRIEIQNYEDSFRKKEFSERIAKSIKEGFTLGPVNQPCPCCGRG